MKLRGCYDNKRDVRKKIQVEEDIQEILNEFIKETGVKIKYIDFDKLQTIGTDDYSIVNLTLKIEI